MKLSKLILTEMVIRGRKCIVCAAAEEQKIMEFRLEPSDKKNTLNNIYVGQIEKTAANIQAAFAIFRWSRQKRLFLQVDGREIPPFAQAMNFWFRSTVRP